MRVRQSHPSPGATDWYTLIDSTAGWPAPTTSFVQYFPGTTSIVTVTGQAVPGLTDAGVDGIQAQVLATTTSGVIYALYLDATYVTQPTVGSVVAPTGTITTTNQPLVEWARVVDTDGGLQERLQVRIFNAAQYGAGGFDPATSTATLESPAYPGYPDPQYNFWTPTGTLPDGTYRAYVRFAQLVNGVEHWSPYAFSSFVINVLLPAAPTITVTPQSSSGRHMIVLAGNAGAATTDAFDLERSADGGVTWAPVRNAFGLQSRIDSASATVYDYEAPNGVTVTYRARALHNYSGAYAASAWVQTTALWTSTAWWLKHPSLPALNVAIELVAYGDVTRAARHGVFQPLGAALPIVVADTRAGAAGSSIAQTRSTATKESLEALSGRTDTLMLQGPAVAGEPDRYVRVGDLTAVRTVENVHVALRRFTLPWTEVALPDGQQTGAQYEPPPEEGEELVLI